VTKQELIKRVASTPGVGPLAKRDVAILVDAVFNHIATYFVEARVGKRKPPRFSYPGFGTFTKKRKAPRTVKNPQNGEPIAIPETVTLAFQPGQELKGHLNGGPRRRRTG
jgi:DNA-binding protein HU-beta